MTTNELFSQLSNLNRTSPYIQASALISKDGMVVASALPQEVDEDAIGAMSAGILSMASRSSHEFSAGTIEQMLIKSAKGYILMVYAGKEAILTVLAKPNARLEFILLEMNRSVSKIATYI